MDARQSKQDNRFAHPQRISITLAQHVFDGLVTRSQRQGRSLSNLSAYLLETALNESAPLDQ